MAAGCCRCVPSREWIIRCSSLRSTLITLDSTAAPGALVEALRRVDAVGGFGWPDDRCPFPRLRPFDVDQHRVFFGRVSASVELAELLRSPAEQAKAGALLVVGPSGCGKSSLVSGRIAACDG